MDRNGGNNADRHSPSRPVARGRQAARAEQQPARREARPAPRRTPFFRRPVVMIVILFLVIVGGGAAIYFSRAITDPGAVLVNRPTAAPGHTAGQQAPGQTGGAQTAAGGAQNTDINNFSTDIVNILVLGTDADAARVKQGMNARTDCVMIASINTKTKKVSLISIPRDTYVDIYDENNKVVDKNRINAAFAYGGGLKQNGAPYAINTVSHFLGGKIPIDHYVLFDMDLVTRLVEAVGGVTVDVDISVDVNSVHLRPGLKKLNGAEALVYARDRHNTPGGDFGRVGHQQQVMIALLKEMQNKGNIVKSIPALYASLTDDLSTDPQLGALQITALAWIAKDVKPSSIQQYTVKGESHSVNGASIVVADQSSVQSIVQEVFSVNYQLNSSATYDNMKSDIDKALNAGKGIVSTAQKLLDNNKPYYTADDASALKGAISAWQAASKKNDADAMTDAQQDVQTEYDILRNIIEQNKNKPTATPKPSKTDATGEPTGEPTQKPTASPTDKPTDKPTEKPTPSPSPSSDGTQDLPPESTATGG